MPDGVTRRGPSGKAHTQPDMPVFIAVVTRTYLCCTCYVLYCICAHATHVPIVRALSVTLDCN